MKRDQPCRWGPEGVILEGKNHNHDFCACSACTKWFAGLYCETDSALMIGTDGIEFAGLLSRRLAGLLMRKLVRLLLRNRRGFVAKNLAQMHYNNEIL
jgi:hypothetical protein